jgi:hypothetical protein
MLYKPQQQRFNKENMNERISMWVANENRQNSVAKINNYEHIRNGVKSI